MCRLPFYASRSTLTKKPCSYSPDLCRSNIDISQIDRQSVTRHRDEPTWQMALEVLIEISDVGPCNSPRLRTRAGRASGTLSAPKIVTSVECYLGLVLIRHLGLTTRPMNSIAPMSYLPPCGRAVPNISGVSPWTVQPDQVP